MNPYEVLEIDNKASNEQIKIAFRTLARKWHPDLFHSEDEIKFAEEKMKEINSAWELIGTIEKRAEFDAKNPITVNVYEYYASKSTSSKPKKKNRFHKKNKTNIDIEKEKILRAVLQFLEVEKERSNEIFELFDELAYGALYNSFSPEEYIEMLELILQEANDCIKNLKEIISIAKEKQIDENSFSYAIHLINKLNEKISETPKTLEQAHFLEESKVTKEKIDELMDSFSKRIIEISQINIVNKTWEFNNNNDVSLFVKNHNSTIFELIKDLDFVLEKSKQFNIELEYLDLWGIMEFGMDHYKSVEFCREFITSKTINSVPSLQYLQEKFWKDCCIYKKNKKRTTLETVYKCSGNFICPPNINHINKGAFTFFEKNLNSITIPSELIYSKTRLELISTSLNYLIFTFKGKKQIVDVSNFPDPEIYLINNYICISKRYSSKKSFILVNSDNIFVYDNNKFYELNNVSNQEELEKISYLWSYGDWNNYQIQIHTWAQLTNKLPHPSVMQVVPCCEESIKRWIDLDKTNFEKAMLFTDNDLKLKLMRLYIGLGALNDVESYYQAEYLISKLDVSKQYRSRLERYSKTYLSKKDSMLSVPKSAVNFVEKNINNKEFLPYIFAFLEGYNFFTSEAELEKVELSCEFVIRKACEYILKKKTNNISEFIKELLEYESKLSIETTDKILKIRQSLFDVLNDNRDKKIIETIDSNKNSLYHYKYLDIRYLKSYLNFVDVFKEKHHYYNVEAENVFLSDNTHAIEILDNNNENVAVVILNLFDNGELFADILNNYRKELNIGIIETIKQAIIDQKNCNNLISSISIGMNEDPYGKNSSLREVINKSTIEWTKEIKYIKFAHEFKNKILNLSYKGYRVKFMIDNNS